MSITSSPELDAEAAHLAHARAGLARMRERADALKAAGGNAVSTEYLAAALHRRGPALCERLRWLLSIRERRKRRIERTDANAGSGQRWRDWPRRRP